MSRVGGTTFPGSLLRDNRNFSYGETPTEPAVSSRVASRVSQLAPTSPSAASSPSPSPWYYVGQDQKIKAQEGVERGQQFNRLWDALPDDKKINFSKGAPTSGDFYGDFGKGRVYGPGVVGAGQRGVTITPINPSAPSAPETPLGKAPIDPMAVAKANALAHFTATGGLDLAAPPPAAPAAGLANTVGAMAPSSPINFAMGPTPGGQPQHVTTINELQNQLLAQKMQSAGVVAPSAAPGAPVAAAPQNTPSSAPAPGPSVTGVPTPTEVAGSRSLGVTVDKYRQIAQESASIGVTPDQYMHLTPKEVTTLQQQQLRNKGAHDVASINAQTRQTVAAGNNQTRQAVAQTRQTVAAGNNQTSRDVTAQNNQTREAVAAGNNQSKEKIAADKADQGDRQYKGKLAEQHAATEERIRHDLKIEGQKGRIAPDQLAKMKLEWDKENNKRALYKLPALPYPDYLSGGQKPNYSQTGTNDKGEKVGLNPQTNQWEAILP